jgi:hypothetical protein
MTIKNTKIGLTGWLSPIGEFHPCEFGEHYKLASEILEKDERLSQRRVRWITKEGTVRSADEFLRRSESKWIPMGSKGEGYDKLSYVFISPEKITDEQRWFFAWRFHELDENQIDILAAQDIFTPEEIQMKYLDRVFAIFNKIRASGEKKLKETASYFHDFNVHMTNFLTYFQAATKKVGDEKRRYLLTSFKQVNHMMEYIRVVTSTEYLEKQLEMFQKEMETNPTKYAEEKIKRIQVALNQC